MTINGAQSSRGARLLLTLAVLVWAGAAQAQSLDEIIEATLAATGGREAIERIETVRRTGTFTMGTEFGDIQGDTEVVTIANQKTYQSLTSDFFSQTSAWDGTLAWQSDDFQGTVELTGSAAANLRNQTILDLFLPYRNPEFDDVQYAKRDDQQVAGRDHFVVEISAGGLDYRVFLDKETHLVTQLIVELDSPQFGGPVEVTVRVSQYETFEGVEIPTRTQMSIPGIFNIDTTYDQTEINGPVDEAIFEKP